VYKKDLVNHQLAKHTENAEKPCCPLCNQTFSYKANMVRHIQKVHAGRGNSGNPIRKARDVEQPSSSLHQSENEQLDWEKSLLEDQITAAIHKDQGETDD